MMNTKKIAVGLLAVLILAFSFSLVSAASLSVDSSTIDFPNDVNHDDGTFVVSFELENSGLASTLDWTSSTVSPLGKTSLTFSIFNIADGSTTPVTEPISVVVSFDSNLPGPISGTIVATPTSGNPKSVPFSVNILPEKGLQVTEKTELTATNDGVLEVKNTGNIALTGIDLEVVAGGDFDVDFSENAFNLAPGATKNVDITSTTIGTVGFGGKSVSISAEADDGTNDSLTVSIEGSFCRAGVQGGNLEITDVNIDNRGEGQDDEWQLLDIIEVEVKVENNGDDDIKEVFVELGLFDSEGKNQVSDLEFDNSDEEEFDVGRINDGDDETVTFRFKVPADFDDGSYKMTVKAYSDDLGEDAECTDVSSDLSDDTFESIDVDRETDEGKFMAFDDFVVSPGEVTCGERFAFNFGVFNIGDEDQEDRIKINVVNSELGIDESTEITKDLDQGDDENVNFELVIPQNAEDGIYQLRLSADYDYNRGSYRESSDIDTLFPLRVLGCGVGGSGNMVDGNRVAVISATLDSDAVAGEELVVRVGVTNVGTKTTGFVIDPRGFSSWASLDSISQNVVELAPGESKDIILRFNVKEDVSGEESFVVGVQADGKTETREVAVNIQGSGSSTGGVGGLNLGDNTYLWIIGIVNVILIILIIIVAVRISRR